MEQTNIVRKDLNREQRKFEFTVYLNNHIIVQRFFNVIGFNNKALRSMNFKETIDQNMGVIQQHMKNKTLDFMTENSDMFYENPSYDQNDSPDVMRIEVKMEDKVIANRQWSATKYPLNVRHTVDIRGYIYDMITRIQKCLSEKTDRLETTYLGYNLLVTHNNFTA